jgi:capsular polysaccharide export protein
MPELTFQGSLDAFWTEATPPVSATFDCFRRVVAARTQVNGGFFSKAGLELAVARSLAALDDRVQDRRVPAVATKQTADPAIIGEDLETASLAV